MKNEAELLRVIRPMISLVMIDSVFLLPLSVAVNTSYFITALPAAQPDSESLYVRLVAGLTCMMVNKCFFLHFLKS